MHGVLVRAAGLALLTFAVPTVYATTLPPGFTEEVVAAGLSQTIAMAFSPDGRLFVCEKSGHIRVIVDDTLLAEPFLTLDVETAGSNGSNGILGVAFDPQFATNRYFYVHYTARASGETPARNRVSRFTADGDTADPATEVVILEIHDVSVSGHYGGDMHFGPDGKLYVAVGQYDSPSSAQLLTDLKGKILRVNANPADLIPTDNPFYGQATGNNRAIWALGLRNPFTFAFDPQTGKLFVNDVGETSFEEIDEGVRGANYGWPESEGPTSDPDFRGPFHYYGRDQGCALTAGVFYNPAARQFPAEYAGRYFFADWCEGWIRTVDPASPASVAPFAAGTSFPMDLEVGPDGGLYYIEWHGSSVLKIEYSAGPAPTVYEAENATLFGAAVRREHGGYTGSGYADYTNVSGDYVQWTVTAAASGSHALDFRYALTGANRPLELRVNGVVVGTVPFLNTGGWSTWRVSSLMVTLNAGANAVRLTAVGSSGPNVDSLAVSAPAAPAPPAAPSGLSATAASSTGINLSWTDNSSDETGFRIERSPDGVAFSEVATVGAGVTSYANTGLAPQTTYSYRVRAYNGNGSSGYSNVAGATTPGGSAPTVYEAESAALFGAAVRRDNGGYTGSGYADYVNASGDYVQWTVTASASGTRMLEFRYALSGANRPLELRVNGVAVGTVPFLNTGGWTTWRVSGVAVPLNAGANTVRLTAVGSSGPNVDSLTVR
jgi:glucose/arabinose dehydrogenase